MTKRHIVLCADDYGQAPAISHGILALLKHDRLSAVSCMVTTTHWPRHARWLKPFLSQVDVGLHFNLTEGKQSLSHLMGRAVLHQLSEAAIVVELNIQLDAFVEAMGCLPRFIDGHQHVHQFPVVRNALIRVYEQRLKSQKSYIRLINQKLKPVYFLRDFKKRVVQAMGTQALKRLLLQHHIPHNSSFSGMYSFACASRYAQFFPHFLAEIEEGGMIMCHPGFLSSDLGDVIAHARHFEYQYFASKIFLEDCAAQDVVVAPFFR